MQEAYSSYRRWYEKQPDTSKVVAQLQLLPQEFQECVAEAIVILAEQKHQVLELLKSLKSLGRDLILAIHKAKNKRRELDQKPMVFKALWHMQILPVQECAQLSKELLQLFNHLYDYMTICKFYDCHPHIQTVTIVSRAFALEGMSTSSLLLDLMEQELQRAFFENSDPAKYATMPGIVSPSNQLKETYQQVRQLARLHKPLTCSLPSADHAHKIDETVTAHNETDMVLHQLIEP